MKKYILLFLFSCCSSAFAQQWALTNNDLTIQVVKNTTITTQVGKWLADFAVVGDSVVITYQRNRDDAHFKLYLDKDSVTAPVVASSAALYDTLEAWTMNAGIGGVAGVTSVSQAFGITATPNPIVATGSIAVDSTQVATPYDLSILTKVDSIDRRIDSVFYYINGTEYFAFLDSTGAGGSTNLTFSGASSPVTLNSSTGTDVTFTSGAGISLSATATDLTIASTITQYTDEMAQDAVGAMINTSLQYVDGTPLLAINDRDFGDVDVSGSGLTWTVDTNAITNVKVNDVAIGKVTGLGANVATWLATPSSANLATAITDETGTGLSVFNNSPTFADDITIGTVASATGDILINGLTSGTVTITTNDVAGTWTWIIPPDDGDANEVLTTNGSGVSTWEPVSATVITTANEAVDATCFPVFVNAATGSQAPKTNTNLTFDASISRLGASTFVGIAFLSSSANVATTGVFRAANTGKISWRNAANSTQYGLTLNASDIFEFDAGAAGVKSNAYIDAVSGFRVNGAATGAAAAGTFLFGNGTNYIASTSTIPTSAGATVGTWLKSDGTNYILSTSTLAEGAVTAGKILVSDATNWVASTPTFPNASATSGKIITSDGTNWVASTETYAAPGTSGNILQSDGTNWTSAASFKMTTGQTTADRTSTSTSLADVTDLAAFSTAASTKYYFEFNVSVTTNATTVGIWLSVNHSTAITSINFNILYPISATANNIQQNLTALNGGVQPTAGNGATIQFAKVWGIMTTNTAGTFALRFASETGAAVVVKAGSTGTLQVVN